MTEIDNLHSPRFVPVVDSRVPYHSLSEKVVTRGGPDILHPKFRQVSPNFPDFQATFGGGKVTDSEKGLGKSGNGRRTRYKGKPAEGGGLQDRAFIFRRVATGEWEVNIRKKS